MAERQHLVLTAIGPDEIGLIEKISKFISSRGCNIEDSKMAVFYGEFAIILLISGHGPDLAKVSDHQSVIERESGLKVNIKSPSARKAAEFYLPYSLVASCMDHPGIVSRISGLLSGLGFLIGRIARLEARLARLEARP